MSLLDQVTHMLFDMGVVLLGNEPLDTVADDRIMAPSAASARPVIQKFGLPLTPEELLALRKPMLQELLENAPAMPAGCRRADRQAQSAWPSLGSRYQQLRPLFELKTQHHPWFSHFDAIVCGDDPLVKNPKPAPDIFLAAAERLGIAADKYVIFENLPAGVEAALAGGARAIALVDPQRPAISIRSSSSSPWGIDPPRRRVLTSTFALSADNESRHVRLDIYTNGEVRTDTTLGDAKRVSLDGLNCAL